ncbi:aldo/keto reductase [Prochlorococcus sp. MIT 1307]|uniref:aldo/keto reductase n=1 Tax=Prochlorococcus sp. MIT 1307 TaxID=3096219 RepID=UPI002A75C2C9|nr:aldo/keto reductase [Prochlorococcus sp. MIT 1307]
MPLRRFGRTGIEMPVLSLGGMRFQQSWSELQPDEITPESQQQLERTLSKAKDCGLTHVETARHYGSSELQLGWGLKTLPDRNRILQTKVPPREDSKKFEAELELSFQRLGCEKLDLLAIHGINLSEHLVQTFRPGGCLEVVRRWQDLGRVGHVGFSTHGSKQLIVEAINSDEFDYVNLHWYFIRQDNDPALDAAAKLDLGVFIISPTDKGGHLHTPSPKLLDLCAPLHPIVFNDLFCLKDSRVHTISVGAAKPEDLDHHLKAIELLNRAGEYVPRIEESLYNEARIILGESWLSSWHIGLPSWKETPGRINIPILLWLYNLVEAWDMDSFAKARYGLLGNGSHWFPGENADCLDRDISEEALRRVLAKSPWCNQIPSLLRKLRNRVGGSGQERLSST